MKIFERIFKSGNRLRRVWIVGLSLTGLHSGVAFVSLAIAPARTIQAAAESRWVHLIWYPHHEAIRSDTPLHTGFLTYVRTIHGRSEEFLCVINMVKNFDDVETPFEVPRIGFPTKDEWNEMFNPTTLKSHADIR